RNDQVFHPILVEIPARNPGWIQGCVKRTSRLKSAVPASDEYRYRIPFWHEVAEIGDRNVLESVAIEIGGGHESGKSPSRIFIGYGEGPVAFSEPERNRISLVVGG